MTAQGLYTVLASLAGIFSVLLNVSPLKTVKRMQEDGSVGASNILFFSAQKWCAILWATYGVMRGSLPLIIANVIGNAVGSYAMINFVHLAIRETSWGARRLPTTTLTATLITAAGFLCMSWGHLLLQFVLSARCQAGRGEIITGLEASIASIVMLSAPLSTVRHIIEHRDASSLNLLTTVFGFANALLWVIAGGIVHDMVLVIPNAVCWLATCGQLYLIAKYRRTDTVVSAAVSAPHVNLPGLDGAPPPHATVAKARSVYGPTAVKMEL